MTETRVVIYQNPEGPNVCLTIGVTKTPEEIQSEIPFSFIVERDSLPLNKYFDAWRIDSSGNVVVDVPAARLVCKAILNGNASVESQKRQNNTLIGIGNAVSDEDFIAGLNAKRAQIDLADTVAALDLIDLTI